MPGVCLLSAEREDGAAVQSSLQRAPCCCFEKLSDERSVKDHKAKSGGH